MGGFVLRDSIFERSGYRRIKTRLDSGALEFRFLFHQKRGNSKVR
jgi:hypothetical protein